MKKYKQLTLGQRYQIQALLQAGLNRSAIARQLGVHRSTIGRELERNMPKRGRTAFRYLGGHAQEKADRRHSTKPKLVRLTGELKARIAGLMEHEKWSPELIAKRSGHRDHKAYKQHYRHLRHNGRRQKRGNLKDSRGAISGRVGIEHRPEVVGQRSRIGDVEVDLMMGAAHKLALLVMTDRTTLVTMIEKLESKNAGEINEKMIKRLTNFDSSWVKTITFDNGKEFVKHYEIAELLNVKTFFTRPYTSQDKGTVENRISVIRRFFPKKTDLRKVTQKRIKEVEKLLNYRPIRKFNYDNPIEQLKNKCVALMG